MTFRRVEARMFITLILVFSACSAPAHARPGLSKNALQNWTHVGVGSLVYMGADGSPLNDSAQLVCPTAADYFQWTRTQRIGPCRAVRHGTPAIVESIIPRTRGKHEVPYTLVGVRAVNKSWHGYTEMLLLQPHLVPGVILTMGSDIAGGPAKLTARSNSLDGLAIGRDIKVRVLKYDPANRRRTLYVKVLEGKYRGSVGWMDIANAKTDVLGRYGCCSY